MYTYASEIWPSEIRAEGIAISMVGYWLATIAILQGAPTGFDRCGWKFYLVFIVCTVVMWFFVAFCLPETSNIPMEEIGRLFGDEVAVTLEEHLKQHGHGKHGNELENSGIVGATDDEKPQVSIAE